jgi:putative CocE/NonD family hydrolase
LAPDEIADLGELAMWAAAQPWCNGRVGAYGTSYTGSTAELSAATGAPALKAVFPRFNEFDLYTDIAFPGGVPLQAFIRRWGEANEALDANRLPPSAPWWERLLVCGVKPVDADPDRALRFYGVPIARRKPTGCTSNSINLKRQAPHQS